MEKKKVSKYIGDVFLKEFISRVLNAQAQINFARRKNSLFIPVDIPPTAPIVVAISNIQEVESTPSLMPSIISEEMPKVEHTSLVPRVLLAPQKVPLSKTPIANYGPSLSLSRMVRQGPIPIPMSPQLPIPSSQVISMIGSEKLGKILSSPGVSAIECLGSGKPLRVTANGIIRDSNIILSEDEISILMNNISQKTRIPLVPGLFKALMGNYIVIAVVSEFVGTRFVIQRR